MLNNHPSKTVQTLAMSLGIVFAGISGIAVQTQAQTPILGMTTPRSTTFQIADASTIAEMERAIFNRINEYRTAKGLRPMVWNDEIARQAREHSRNMAKKVVPFGHQGFEKRAKELSAAIQSRGTGENVGWVASKRDPAGMVIDAWIKSHKHRDNIEGDFSMTGIGIGISAMGEYYFTQDFVRR
ncbi:CAP domain-containing protein [Leptolyngbya sp. NIES-2104]|uniref:CAP domain-containing protein n=1 Tax=Leptolyngbya sp. NIES-2104 TaxID=1552121 RepID=UPI0006ECBCA0|nr:CAP domain-containing protein [Leptolyngbya sp. NIES-2104]GAP94391.1 transporter [Leptolyngbya sp. NIES-2104]